DADRLAAVAVASHAARARGRTSRAGRGRSGVRRHRWRAAVSRVRHRCDHPARAGQPELSWLGAIVNRYDRRVGAQTFQLEGLPETFGADLIWQPHVPERAAAKDAADAAIPLRQLGGSRGAELAEI